MSKSPYRGALVEPAADGDSERGQAVDGVQPRDDHLPGQWVVAASEVADRHNAA